MAKKKNNRNREHVLERQLAWEERQRAKRSKRNKIVVLASGLAVLALIVTVAIAIPALNSPDNKASDPDSTSSQTPSDTPSDEPTTEPTAEPSVVDANDYSGALPTINIGDGVPTIAFPSDFTDPSDLVVKVLEEGNGEVLSSVNDTIKMNYSGWTNDGKEFDSSIDPNIAQPHLEPFSMQNNVIDGWKLGIDGRHVGDKLMLVIPSDLAYGPSAAAAGRPAGTLTFYVDVLEKVN